MSSPGAANGSRSVESLGLRFDVSPPSAFNVNVRGIVEGMSRDVGSLRGPAGFYRKDLNSRFDACLISALGRGGSSKSECLSVVHDDVSVLLVSDPLIARVCGKFCKVLDFSLMDCLVCVNLDENKKSRY